MSALSNKAWPVMRGLPSANISSGVWFILAGGKFDE